MRHLSSVIYFSGRQIRRCGACLYVPQKSFNDWQKKSYSTHSKKNSSRKIGTQVAVVLGTTLAAGYGVYHYERGHKRLNSETNFLAEDKKPEVSAGQYRSSLPTYNRKQVSAHCNEENGVWVTYGEGVYDITKFLDSHPGGREKISMAAGGALEPFWSLFGFHKAPDTLALLEEFRIGNLSANEVQESTADMQDPYGNEPLRHPALKPSSTKPFNAEPPLSLLVESFISPTDLFYVRNHLPVPEVDPDTYELEIAGNGVREMTLTLDDIKKFPKYTVTATVQCAGNRRSEMSKVKPVKGLSWGQAAIGNGTWSGARLSDVLAAAGVLPDRTKAEHVQFEGLDTDISNNPYGASIPIEKALDPNGDVLLAYEMNGEPIPRDHGFPIRVVVPGVVGARSVKWLGRIIVSEEESPAHWQQNDYKGFSPSTDWDTVDFSKSPAIQELPVISAICEPLEGAEVKLKEGKMIVRGYAWSGGGRKIVRVDVTADQGKSWLVAEFTDQDAMAKAPRHWAWTLWKVEIPIPPDTKEVEVWAKAVDSSYNVQPETFENIWNLRGVLANAYHRVKVKVAQECGRDS